MGNGGRTRLFDEVGNMLPMDIVGEAPKEKRLRAVKGKADKVISIPEFVKETITVPVYGTSPLIMHKFSEKTKKQMLDKHMKKSQPVGKEAKDPALNMLLATHFIDGPTVVNKIYEAMRKDEVEPGEDVTKYFNKARVGFPAGGFKLALIDACRQTEGLTMSLAKGLFYVLEDYNGLVEIFYKGVLFKEDYARTAHGTPDIRHRAAFYGWSAKPKLNFNPKMISAEQLANLVRLAGFCAGIGDWRPSSPKKPGSNGMFDVA